MHPRTKKIYGGLRTVCISGMNSVQSLPLATGSSRHFFDFLHTSYSAFAVGDEADGGIDHRTRGQFGTAPQGGVAEFGIELFERQASDNFVAEQAGVDRVGIFARLNHKLIEAGRAREQDLGMLRELAGRIRGLRQVLFCQLFAVRLCRRRS